MFGCTKNIQPQFTDGRDETREQTSETMPSFYSFCDILKVFLILFVGVILQYQYDIVNHVIVTSGIRELLGEDEGAVVVSVKNGHLQQVANAFLTADDSEKKRKRKAKEQDDLTKIQAGPMPQNQDGASELWDNAGCRHDGKTWQGWYYNKELAEICCYGGGPDRVKEKKTRPSKGLSYIDYYFCACYEENSLMGCSKRMLK